MESRPPSLAPRGAQAKAPGWAFVTGSADKPLAAGVQGLAANGIGAFCPDSKAQKPLPALLIPETLMLVTHSWLLSGVRTLGF